MVVPQAGAEAVGRSSNVCLCRVLSEGLLDFIFPGNPCGSLRSSLGFQVSLLIAETTPCSGGSSLRAGLIRSQIRKGFWRKMAVRRGESPEPISDLVLDKFLESGVCRGARDGWFSTRGDKFALTPSTSHHLRRSQGLVDPSHVPMYYVSPDTHLIPQELHTLSIPLNLTLCPPLL